MTNHENRQASTAEEKILFYQSLKIQLGDSASSEEIKEINEKIKELELGQSLIFKAEPCQT